MNNPILKNVLGLKKQITKRSIPTKNLLFSLTTVAAIILASYAKSAYAQDHSNELIPTLGYLPDLTESQQSEFMAMAVDLPEHSTQLTTDYQEATVNVAEIAFDEATEQEISAQNTSPDNLSQDIVDQDANAKTGNDANFAPQDSMNAPQEEDANTDTDTQDSDNANGDATGQSTSAEDGSAGSGGGDASGYATTTASSSGFSNAGLAFSLISGAVSIGSTMLQSQDSQSQPLTTPDLQGEVFSIDSTSTNSMAPNSSTNLVIDRVGDLTQTSVVDVAFDFGNNNSLASSISISPTFTGGSATPLTYDITDGLYHTTVMFNPNTTATTNEDQVTLTITNTAPETLSGTFTVTLNAINSIDEIGSANTIIENIIAQGVNFSIDTAASTTSMNPDDFSQLVITRSVINPSNDLDSSSTVDIVFNFGIDAALAATLANDISVTVAGTSGPAIKPVLESDGYYHAEIVFDPNPNATTEEITLHIQAAATTAVTHFSLSLYPTTNMDTVDNPLQPFSTNVYLAQDSVIITEIMLNQDDPAVKAILDAVALNPNPNNGRPILTDNWIEIQNTTGHAINLNGVEISTNDGNDLLILTINNSDDQNTILQPNSYAVISAIDSPFVTDAANAQIHNIYVANFNVSGFSSDLTLINPAVIAAPSNTISSVPLYTNTQFATQFQQDTNPTMQQLIEESMPSPAPSSQFSSAPPAEAPTPTLEVNPVLDSTPTPETNPVPLPPETNPVSSTELPLPWGYSAPIETNPVPSTEASISQPLQESNASLQLSTASTIPNISSIELATPTHNNESTWTSFPTNPLHNTVNGYYYIDLTNGSAPGLNGIFLDGTPGFASDVLDNLYTSFSPVIGTNALVEGNLIITEYMAKANNIAGDPISWFEINNTTGNVIALSGLTLETTESQFTIDSNIFLQPGQYYTFGTGQPPAGDNQYISYNINNTYNTNTNPSAIVSTNTNPLFQLSDQIDTITLKFINPTNSDTTVIDSVTYGSQPNPDSPTQGQSAYLYNDLNPAVWSGASWHLSNIMTPTYDANLTDHGTPNEDNSHNYHNTEGTL